MVEVLVPFTRIRLSDLIVSRLRSYLGMHRVPQIMNMSWRVGTRRRGSYSVCIFHSPIFLGQWRLCSAIIKLEEKEKFASRIRCDWKYTVSCNGSLPPSCWRYWNDFSSWSVSFPTWNGIGLALFLRSVGWSPLRSAKWCYQRSRIWISLFVEMFWGPNRNMTKLNKAPGGWYNGFETMLDTVYANFLQILNALKRGEHDGNEIRVNALSQMPSKA